MDLTLLEHPEHSVAVARVLAYFNLPALADAIQDRCVEKLMESLQSLSLDSHEFQGKSSHAMLIKAAVDLKGLPPRTERMPPPSLTPTRCIICALGPRYPDDSRVEPIDGAPAGSNWFDQVQLCPPTNGSPFNFSTAFLGLPLAGHPWDSVSDWRKTWGRIDCVPCLLLQNMNWRSARIGVSALIIPSDSSYLPARILGLFDTHLSSFLGRPVAIQPHDFDLALPVCCDDEYGNENPLNAGFHEPLKYTSLVNYFTCQLMLNDIVCWVLKTLYAHNRSERIFKLLTDNWQEKLVTELDAALNRCFDSCGGIPHGRTTSGYDGAISQSENLPHMICNNAARSCISVAEAQQSRRPNNPFLFGHTAMFTACVILALDMLGISRSRAEHDADVADVQRCMRVPRTYEPHWPSASALRETLERLVKVDERRPYGNGQNDPEPLGLAQSHTAGGDSHPLAQLILGRAMGSATRMLDPAEGSLAAHLTFPQITWTEYFPQIRCT
ncbi:hypothetical protein C8R43DRAFT_1124626 [Mycena crocata]|nr:hypothetical protein C8R43DRAFT_1124626 [Mycena crocata]